MISLLEDGPGIAIEAENVSFILVDLLTVLLLHILQRIDLFIDDEPLAAPEPFGDGQIELTHSFDDWFFVSKRYLSCRLRR